jgi:hypothetical protein
MAEVKDITIPLNADGTIGISSIQNILKKKEPPQVIGSYKYKSQTLFLIGYISGKAGTENKHELPPPHDTILPFGDIIVLSSKDQNSWTNPVPFKMSDYETFYTRAFGGFDDLDSEEEGEEEVVEDTNEIIDEVVEEEEGEEPEDDEGGDEVAAECNDDMEGDAELVSTRVVSKKKKRTGTVNMVMGGAAQIYASYLHVPEKDEILVESFELPYEERNITTQRRRVLNIL